MIAYRQLEYADDLIIFAFVKVTSFNPGIKILVDLVNRLVKRNSLV